MRVLPNPPASASVAASSLADLERAFADPTVTEVILSDNIALTGTALVLTGAGRLLSLRPGASACSRSRAASVPTGMCEIDAGFRSRHFVVQNGASLTLQGLALTRGAALQGGSVLAIGGASASASGCLFADSTALGDGGALLAVNGSTLIVRGSAFRNCSSLRAFGGAAAAVYGSTLQLSDSAVESCHAQSGGGLTAIFGSQLLVTSSVLANCRCETPAALRHPRHIFISRRLLISLTCS